MPRGRKKLFDEATIVWIKDNPEQLSYSELAQKFSCAVQTIKRVVKNKDGYKTVDG